MLCSIATWLLDTTSSEGILYESPVEPKKVSLVLTSMASNGGWSYIDGHLDLRPVKRWPHSITDDDLNAVIEALLTPTGRVSPNLNPHAHCQDAVAPFSITGERMNVAGSLFSGLSMRCTSTPPWLLARQKKARSSVPHRRRAQSRHCNIMREIECSVASLPRSVPTAACGSNAGNA